MVIELICVIIWCMCIINIVHSVLNELVILTDPDKDIPIPNIAPPIKLLICACVVKELEKLSLICMNTFRV